MAQAGRASSTDRNIIAAVAAYCAEYAELKRLCEHYGTLPDELAGPIFDRMRQAKGRAVKRSAVSMAGVIAKARMVETGELDDVDPLVASTIRDLLNLAQRVAVPYRQAPSSFLPHVPCSV